MCADQFEEKHHSLQKEVYVQTQNWSRHNETLIIATNTVLLGAIAAISANYFKAAKDYSSGIYWLPFVIAGVGIVVTIYLSRQYKLAITRVIAYEKFFKLHEDCDGMQEIAKLHSGFCAKWYRTFVPEYLASPPIFGAASSWFFLFVHLCIFVLSAWQLFVA